MASAEKLKEIKDEYLSSLNDLTINSKPLINMLTMLAEDNIDNSTVIVQAVEEHLQKVPSEFKLPVLYLIDSIVKNVGKTYTPLFTQNIVANFCSVFEKVDERIRAQMFKLRQTWGDVFPAKKMYALDVRVNNIDPAWPIIAPAPTPSIHVNPKFFNKSAVTTSASVVKIAPPITTPAAVADPATIEMRTHLINKQKELLELQQRKIELELLQAKVRLEEQQKQFELNQKSPSTKTVTTTTTTIASTMPSMKTVLTKPNAIPSPIVKSTVEIKSTKTLPRIPSQVINPLANRAATTTTSISNGPKIAPVNSVLVASVRIASRDPRLAAKQHVPITDTPILENKSSKNIIDQPVNTEKHKVNHTSEFSNKSTLNKVSSLNTIKDPRLVSSKVQGRQSVVNNKSLGSGKSGSRGVDVSTSRHKNSGLSNRKGSSKANQRGVTHSDILTKTNDFNEVNSSNNKSSKIDKNSHSDTKTSRSSSHSPTKSKKKDSQNSTAKKQSVSVTTSPSSDSPRKRSPEKHSKYGKRTRDQSNIKIYNVDLDSSASPSPPPHSSGTNENERKTFKELKNSTKSRNYMRRNRMNSPSPEIQSKDVDLRVVGPPAEKQPRIQSPTPDKSLESSPSLSIAQVNISSPQITPDSTKDVDLRQIPTNIPAQIKKKRPSVEKPEAPNPKKNKSEMFDVLFGNEDVDLRTLTMPPTSTPQLPVQPPTPPPPIISSPPSSHSHNTNNSNNGWASVKELKSPPPNQSTNFDTVRAKLANATNKDRLGRPLLYNKLPDDPNERRQTISSRDEHRRRPNRNSLIKTDANSIQKLLEQAEEERKSGKLTTIQYQNVMEQVITLVERQKLHEARRMEYINDKGHDVTLQPISDDDLSPDFSDDDDEYDRREERRAPPAPIISNQHKDDSDKTKITEIIDVDATPEPRDPRAEREHSSGSTRGRRWDNTPNVWDSNRPHQPHRHYPWVHPPINMMDKHRNWGQQPILGNFNPLPLFSQSLAPKNPIDLIENRPNVAVGGFVQRPPATRYGPRAVSPPAIGSQTTKELPHADPLVLDYINNDSMRTINIDGKPTEIRYYGETAVAIMNGDNPIEISFQNGIRRITFGDNDSYDLSFNDVAREVKIFGVLHRVRLGAPTRELYIDDKWYECFFGGPGIVIEIDREYRVVKLDGPPPQVKIGNKRNDLCVGRINLIINAKNIVPIFLDAKPQKFDIEGKIHTLRFVDALRTVLINEEPFKVDFGGLPKPIIVHNKKHFIRFTRLPPGIRPGYVDIKDMEGERSLSPPRIENENSIDRPLPSSVTPVANTIQEPPIVDVQTNEPALPMMGKRRQPVVSEPESENRAASPTPVATLPVIPANLLKNFNLELLSSIINTSVTPASNINSSGYNTDDVPPVDSQPNVPTSNEIPGLGEEVQTASVAQQPPQNPVIGLTAPPKNVDDLKQLIQKLEASGILNNVADSLKMINEPKPTPVIVPESDILPVDFSKPETLKIKQPTLISNLYTGMQCSSCGVRFPSEHTINYSRQHLDWHFRQNKKKKHSIRKANSRKWYYDVSDWIQFEEIEDLEEREKSWFENQQTTTMSGENNMGQPEEAIEDAEIPSVEARTAGDNPRCDVCYDAFDQFYNEDKEEWHLRMAIQVDNKLYHPLCYEDFKSAQASETLEESDIKEDIAEEDTESKLEELEIKDDENEDSDTSKDEEEVIEVKADEIPVLQINDDAEKTEPNEKIDDEANDDDLDMSDVCIIEPEEEITIVKLDDIADDDSFEENETKESSSQTPKVEKKMIDVVMADGTIVKIKSEPVDPFMEEPSADLLPSTADTTHASLISSIDGNVQLEPTTTISTNVPSGRIKINITKSLPSQIQTPSVPISEAIVSNEDENSNSEPPPPGEESLPPIPIQLKPDLQGVDLKVQPMVSKGSEASGFCCIM